MAQNKHNTKRRIICILCASIIALYALAIPIGAVVNSSQVPEGSTALYGVSTFPFTVGFVQKDTVNDRNYIFATEVGTYGQNNNQTVEGSDIFYWNFPDASDEESSGITYTQGDIVWLNDLDYTDYANFWHGGYGSINLQYNQITQDMLAEAESIIFKADNVYYNPIWLTLPDYDHNNRFQYRTSPEAGYDYMMPTIYLPLHDTSTQKFVGRYSVECSIIDLNGERHYISYSIPIDTSAEFNSIAFLEMSALKPFIEPTEIVLGETLQNDAIDSNSTILIEQYRGYLDVDYYEFVEPLATSFNIYNNTSFVASYLFEEGMTWTEFISSKYNPDYNFAPTYKKFYGGENGSSVYYNQGGSGQGVQFAYNGKQVYGDDTIINGYNYNIGNAGGGANDWGNPEGPSASYDWGAGLDEGPSASTYDTKASEPTEYGEWQQVTDTDMLNQVLVTYPMWDTSSATVPTEFAYTWFSTPSGEKMLQGSIDIFDKGDEPIIIPEINEDMYRDYTGWLGTAVKGFFDTPLLGGMSLGVIVGVLVMFGCAIGLLKIFAGG